MKIPKITVDFNTGDYQWHAYCHDAKCAAVDGKPRDLATAHTADSIRLTKLVQAVTAHVAEVHGV